MLIKHNAAGGKSVYVSIGEDLERVPKSHRRLISPLIREVFSAPQTYYREIADRSPFPQFAMWLNELLADNRCLLELNHGHWPDGSKPLSAGFRWESDRVRGATLGLTENEVASHLPKDLAAFYRLVGFVSWCGFGCAGGIDKVEAHELCARFAELFPDEPSFPREAIEFGSGANGDMLIYDNQNRGGWLSHDSGKANWIGSIGDSIDSVFDLLRRRKQPDYYAD